MTIGDEATGTVEDVTLRTTVVRTIGGERINVPSALVLKRHIENLTRLGARRTLLPIVVTYAQDLQAAKDVAEQAMAAASRVHAEPRPRALIWSFGDNGIEIALVFWHEPDIASMQLARDAVAFAVKQEFGAAGITIPFPQRTLWWGDREAS